MSKRHHTSPVVIAMRRDPWSVLSDIITGMYSTQERLQTVFVTRERSLPLYVPNSFHWVGSSWQTWGTPAPMMAPLWIIGPSFPTNKPKARARKRGRERKGVELGPSTVGSQLVGSQCWPSYHVRLLESTVVRHNKLKHCRCFSWYLSVIVNRLIWSVFWLVCGRYVVGKGGWYVVGMWLVKVVGTGM